MVNYTGEEVADVKVVLAESFPSSRETIYTTFPSLTLPDRKKVRMAEPFLVLPRWEYEYWEQGGVPRVYIEDLDETGRWVHTRVDLAPWLWGGED